ncbi:hypothetical protein [Paenibacillus sp. 1A_MP2]|uniref:hypothetical protein n=1 Tax=Paenibacillus sp. 1A_MP2 TaxID=3457495 RepID=UPI003FCEB65E
MEKILNGISISSLSESVANILGVSTAEVISFIQSQRYRVRHEEITTYCDNLTPDVIFDYFQKTPDDIQFDAITVSHVAAIIDDQSFYQHGMLSLKDLFLTETPFKSFMLEYGIEPVVHEDGSLQLLLNGEPRSSNHLDMRMISDRCINGFLFGDSPESDRNVSEMVKCPEFISDISRDILRNQILIEEWVKRAKPSVICFRVLLSELDESSYPFSTDDPKHNRCYLLCEAIERLLFAVTDHDADIPMVYLKENVSIGADRIIEIRETTT